MCFRYSDSIAYLNDHTSEEVSDFDKNVALVILSFGQNRDYIFKFKDATKSVQNRAVSLDSGSLLIIDNPTLKFWNITVETQTKCVLPHFSLVFRMKKIMFVN